MFWHILKTDLHVSTVPILTVLSRHCKFQSKMLLNWLVQGGPHICLYYYYILLLTNMCCMYINWCWFKLNVYFYIWCNVYIISTSMPSLSLTPIPWPKEFTPRYHQLQRVAARQRNFDRRWREQLRPLRWQCDDYNAQSWENHVFKLENYNGICFLRKKKYW